MKAIFVDLGESFDDWDFSAGEGFHVVPSEVHRAVWRLDGVLETPDQRTPSVSELTMAHAGPLRPIWDIRDYPVMETLHLLSLEDFTELLNGCVPDALVRNAFILLRVVVTGCYLELKIQELHEALQKTYETIELANEAAMSASLQSAEAAAIFNAECARLAE